MKKRFSAEQVIRFLKEHESEKKLQILFGNTIFLNKQFTVEKCKYSGMDVSEAKHLKQLEEENRQLKELAANLTLDNHILKNVLAKTHKACPEASHCGRDIANDMFRWIKQKIQK